GAENLLRVCIDEHLHEALRLALLDGPPDPRHRAFADEDTTPRTTGFHLGHAHAAERWIDEQAVREDPVTHPAPIAVEQVGRDDLVVVVRRVRERAPAVAIPESPDARDAGAKLVVDDHVAVLVRLHAGPIETEIIGVRSPPDGEQQVRSDNFGRTATFSPRRSPAMHRALSRTLTPSPSRICRVVSDTSSSSRMIRRDCCST